MSAKKTPCSCGCGAQGPKPLALTEVCRALEQNERTLRRWVDADCPHHKGPGKTGKLTFDQAEVVAWMRELGRTGEPGRPPAEVTLLGAGARAPRAPADKEEEKKPGAPPSREELLTLTAQANLRIKQLEGEKRARLERAAGGELHEVEACLGKSLAKIAALKAVFQLLPGKLAQQLADKPYDVVYGILAQELDDVLKGFAK